MKFIYKKAIAVFVAFCLVFAIAAPASEAKAATAKKVYVDVAGSSYAVALNYAIDNGLMSNSGDKIFPGNRLTKGAACLSLNALLGATEPYADMDKVTNLKKGEQYYNTVSVGLNAGYLKTTKGGTAVYSPKAYATYSYLNDIFSSVLGMDMTAVIIGSKSPTATLTRGEYAELLMKLAPNIVTKNTSTVVTGDVYITKPNVVLSNVKVDGNLIITDAVGDQNVTLRSVEVTGKLVVRGGGENSIYAIGNTILPDVIVQQVNSPVSFKVVGNAKVEIVVVKGGKNVKIEGKVDTLEIATDDVNVSLNKATIENVDVKGKGASLTVAENTKVKKVVVNEAAEGTKLNVAGDIENVEVASKDSEVKVVEKGKVKAVKAEKTAKGLSVVVDKEAAIGKVESTADNTVVQGEGTVEVAELTGTGSETNTEGTLAAEPTPAPTTTPSDSGSGGSSGGSTDNTSTYRSALDNMVLESIGKLVQSIGTVNATDLPNGNKNTGAITITLNSDIKVNEISGTNVVQAIANLVGKAGITNITFAAKDISSKQISSVTDLAVLAIEMLSAHGSESLKEHSPATVSITYNEIVKTYTITIQ